MLGIKRHLNWLDITDLEIIFKNLSYKLLKPCFRSSSYSYYTAPDGGWGWVIVAASFLVNMIADGVTFSFGVLFVEFQVRLLKDFFNRNYQDYIDFLKMQQQNNNLESFNGRMIS